MSALRKNQIKNIHHKLIRVVSLMLFIFIILNGCSSNSEDIEERELAIQVKVHTKSIEGTGIIIVVKDNIATVVSPYHVIKSFDETSYIELADKRQVNGAILGFIENQDIAFLTLKIENSSLLNIIKEQVPENISEGFIADRTKCNKKQKVHTYNLYENNQRYDGTVEEERTYLYDLEQTMMLINICALEGMSGSGVFDDYSNVAGMIIAGNGSQAAAFGIQDIYDYYLRITK